MTAAKIHIAGSGARIDWGATVTGDDALLQLVAVALTTVRGSDIVDPSRGTTVLNDILSGRAFDLRSLQHAINFASLKARRDINRRGNDIREIIGAPDLSAGGRPRIDIVVRTPSSNLTTTV